MDKKNKLVVAVLMGGPSSEHEVSLKSGAMVVGALDPAKYEVIPVTIGKDGAWPIDCAALRARGVDLALIAMHGEYGEDGTVQSLLGRAGIPYVGSGAEASARAMDKRASSVKVAEHSVRVPRSYYFSNDEWAGNRAEVMERARTFGAPCVVKPSNLGSSVGVSIVRREHDLEAALSRALEHSREAMVQEYIEGDEVTCGVLDEGGVHKPVALPPTQIIPKASAFFDYEAKYTRGASEEVTPPRLPADVIEEIQRTALAAHEALGCAGLSRTDMMVKKNGDVYYLETNTLPGMTETSLYPQAARAAGIGFSELLDRLIQSAFNTKRGDASK